jgi:hypothetical protein
MTSHNTEGLQMEGWDLYGSARSDNCSDSSQCPTGTSDAVPQVPELGAAKLQVTFHADTAKSDPATSAYNVTSAHLSAYPDCKQNCFQNFALADTGPVNHVGRTHANAGDVSTGDPGQFTDTGKELLV